MSAAGPGGRRGPWRTAVGVVLTAVMLFPVYWMVNVSLTPPERMRVSPPDLFPTAPAFDGYARVLSEQLPFFGTSLLVAAGTVVLTLVIAAPAAFSLAKLRPRGRRVLGFVLLVAQMIPGIVMALGLYGAYVRLGITNTVWGLIVADSTLAVPFAVLILASFMASVPDELVAAAMIDGAGQLRTFWSIVLPVSRNGIITAALFSFLWAWSDFLFATTLDGGGSLQPLTLGIYRYIGNNNQEWNAIMATAVVASLPTAVLLVVAQRFVAAGITSGAVRD